MGVFEYFQLAEALDAEPVWVINNGIAHEDSIPAALIWPLVQVGPPIWSILGESINISNLTLHGNTKQIKKYGNALQCCVTLLNTGAQQGCLVMLLSKAAL